MKELQNKVAVITGGASGIGLALARRFAREGMRLVLADIETEPLTRARAEIAAMGAEAITVPTDVSKPEQVEALAQAAQARFGAVHLVCNNAGVGGILRRAWEADLRDWQWILGVNLWGVIHGVRTFVPIMLAQDCECHMVNTASAAGLLSTPSMSVYSVSKHGVVTLTESLHHELAEIGAKLKVSVLLPAWVATEIWNADRNRPEPLQVPEPEALARSRREARRERMKESRVSAADVADSVLDAVLNERFYIMTHPWIRAAVELRMEEILSGGNPTLPGKT